jgi:hypothetical protein
MPHGFVERVLGEEATWRDVWGAHGCENLADRKATLAQVMGSIEIVAGLSQHGGAGHKVIDRELLEHLLEDRAGQDVVRSGVQDVLAGCCGRADVPCIRETPERSADEPNRDRGMLGDGPNEFGPSPDGASTTMTSWTRLSAAQGGKVFSSRCRDRCAQITTLTVRAGGFVSCIRLTAPMYELQVSHVTAMRWHTDSDRRSSRSTACTGQTVALSEALANR